MYNDIKVISKNYLIQKLENSDIKDIISELCEKNISLTKKF